MIGSIDKNIHCLITGHKGFIGSNIYSFLNKLEGYTVDGFSRGDTLKNIPYDIVIHCAGATPSNIKNDSDYTESNINLTKKILDKYKKSKIIFLSTKDIYGIPNVDIITEETAPYNQSPYGKSKHKAEQIIIDSADNYIILRLPTVVGENSPATFITRMINSISKNKSFNLYNGDKKFNSIIYIEDIILIIKQFLDRDMDNNIFNIASKDFMYIKDIPILICNKLDYKDYIAINQSSDTPSSLVSIDKIQSFITISDTRYTIIEYLKSLDFS